MHLASRAALLLTLALPAVTRAQAAHPDYSGTYVLDLAQSEAGQFAPTKLDQKVTQTAKEFVIDRTMASQMGESKATLHYALDGTPSTNEITMGGNTMKISTVVTWEGDSPVFTSSFDVGGNDVKQVDRWTLTDGGKKLQSARTMEVAGQNMAMKLVLVRK